MLAAWPPVSVVSVTGFAFRILQFQIVKTVFNKPEKKMMDSDLTTDNSGSAVITKTIIKGRYSAVLHSRQVFVVSSLR